MKVSVMLISLCIVLTFAFGCGNGSNTTVPSDAITIKADFKGGVDGWGSGYSDYSDGTAPTDITTEERAFPTPLAGNGFYLSGTNKSGDLFIYVKKKFSGFSPNTKYQATFEVKFATNAPSGCVGVGGPPGEAVWISAGATAVEPQTVLIDGYYRLNIDRENQSVGNKDVVVLGDIANSSTDCSERVYQTKTLTNSTPLDVTSDANGEMWLHVGMDSGFESTSHIYLLTLSSIFIPTK